MPDFELSTEAARALLPASVGHHAAAMNSGRAALLIHALTQKPEFLLPGTEDYLHQSYRAAGHAAQRGPDRRAAARRPCRRRLRCRTHRAGPGQRREAQAEAAVEFIGAFTAGNTPDVGWRVMKLAVDVEGAKVEVHRR